MARNRTFDQVFELAGRHQFLALRWAIVAVYIALANSVFHVGGDALLVSASLLCVYHAGYTWDRLSPPGARAFRALTPYIDVLLVGITLVAVADIESPIWAIYFLCILGTAHVMTPRRMAMYVGCSIASYIAAAGGIIARGGDVSWGYVAVVCVLLVFLGVNAGIFADGEQRLRAVIASVAVTDSLTGIANRRRFQELYAGAFPEAATHGTPLAVMLIDVDHFKEINDTKGHPAGDEKLREVAQAFAGVMRSTDLVARYGGDEFIVLAPGLGRGEAVRLGERLQAAAGQVGIEVSIGFALYPEDAGGEDALVSAADQALYAAKQAGRNRVRAAAA